MLRDYQESDGRGLTLTRYAYRACAADDAYAEDGDFRY